MSDTMMNPHEVTWHQNDFISGDRLIVDGHYCEVLSSGVTDSMGVTLTVAWDDGPTRDSRVWPNMMWVGYEMPKEGG